MFALIFIYILLWILAVLNPYSKKCFILLLIYMFFLSAFCTQNQDTPIYLTRYNYNDIVSGSTEIGFYLYVLLLNLLNCNFQMFLVISYALIFFIIGWFFIKNTNEFNIALSMYACSLIFIDYVQIRSTMAFCFLLIGINELLKEQENNSTLKFLLWLFLSTSFHYSFIIFILFLFAKKWNMSQVLLAVLSVNIIGFAVFNRNNVYWIASHIFNEEKAIMQFDYNDQLLQNNYFSFFSLRLDLSVKYYLSVILSGIIILTMLAVATKNSRYVNDTNKIFQKKGYILIKCFIIILSILPLIKYNVEVYRLQRYSIILGFVAISCYLSIKSGNLKNNKFNNIGKINIQKAICCLGSFAIFIIQIIHMPGIYSTFIPFFQNNILFQ